jgi:NodT family efflux transporter outer membrane factor (OMF) lipoprotein
MRHTLAQSALAIALAATSPASASADGWWRQFHDPALDAAVDAALAGNLDLAAATARVEQARAMDRRAGAALLPSASVGGSAEADSVSRNTPFGAASHELGFPRGYQLYQLGAEAQWEIDLFGGLAARRRVAAAQAGASRADADAVRLMVVVETADACLRLRGLQAQLALAEAQRDVRDHFAELVRQRAGQGLASDFDVNRARASAGATAAAIPPLRAAIAVEIDRLGVLTGGATAWRATAQALVPIPDALAPALDADPARLMRRRPDLVAAEAHVVAAHAGVAVARAEYYPHVSLGGLLGVASLGTASIVSGNAVNAQGSAAIRWRLFDFGRVDAEVAAARGREREVLAQWRRAALGASAEVADAIAALAEGRREQAALSDEVALLTRARAQAQAAYDAGTIGLIDVLDADRSLLEASDRLSRCRASLARASVAAVRAMGGGYGEEADHHG